MALKKKIGVPKQPKPGKRVRIIVPDGPADCQGKFNIQKALRATVPQSPKYVKNSPLAVAFDAWSATTDQADAIYQSIILTQSTLEQLYATLGTTMGQYSVDRASFLVSARAVCSTEDDAKSFGLTPLPDAKSVEAGAPDMLHFVFAAVPGDFNVRWLSVLGAGSYVAEQSSVDPPTEASWTVCYMGKSPYFKMSGLPLGQRLWFRVRSIGKTPSAFCVPAFVVVR